jgi:1-aminocyclopropane-1-carboxylate deaminase/D-cysteine desulfhydrase-like pyridoxal-dependent ACC family enzyme
MRKLKYNLLKQKIKISKPAYLEVAFSNHIAALAYAERKWSKSIGIIREELKNKVDHNPTSYSTQCGMQLEFQGVGKPIATNKIRIFCELEAQFEIFI